MTIPPSPLRWQDLPGAPAAGTCVGALTQFTDGQANLIHLPATPADAPAFSLLVLRQGNQLHAFANRCAHFGVPLATRPHQLISTPLKSLTCNVHYARYAWATGACEAGECGGESLTAVPLVQDAAGNAYIGAEPVSM